MDTTRTTPAGVTYETIEAGRRLERNFDSALSNIKGISYREFQILDALQTEPESKATRVHLARKVGMTPSGVTRALKPMEKLGFIETVSDARDARRALAQLTHQGMELHSDAAGVLSDTIEQMPVSALSATQRRSLVDLLASV